MRARAAFLAASAAVLACPPAPSAAVSLPRQTLLTGFTDTEAYEGSGPNVRAVALVHTKDAGATVVRVFVQWAGVAPVAPPDPAAARDPGWMGYRWDEVDALVRDIASAGLRPFITFYVAPSWAEGAGRPAVSAGVPAGTWRPDPAAYRLFAEAAARRYSGVFADPQQPGGSLPRVSDWQAWNEPNLFNYLNPQWRTVNGEPKAESPVLYRQLLNAFYDGVKAVHVDNLVVSAGTAPFGEPQRGARRMPPAFFTRVLLCVTGRAKPRSVPCNARPAHFDALAHHPYPIGPPRRRAINPDDVVVPDLRKLSRPLDVALRAGTALPRRPKQLWATEISWDTNPPDPDGIPASEEALYVEGALYVLWRAGVNVVTWFELRDSAEGSGWANTIQGGVYYRADDIAQDRPKPAFTAFRFPFTAYLDPHGVAELWGLAPTGGGSVIVDRRVGSAWLRIKTLPVRSDRLFFGRAKLRRGQAVRARYRSETSLTWTVLSGLPDSRYSKTR